MSRSRQRSATAPLLMMVTALSLMTPRSALAEQQKSGVIVIPNADRPGNPDVTIQTARFETSYAGQLDPFEGHTQVMRAFNARFELDSGFSQCFYDILLVGHYYLQDAQTVRFFQDNNFDIFFSNGNGHLIQSNFQVGAYRNEMRINDTDTYETCIVNRGQRKMIAYSSYRVTPPEHMGSEHRLAKFQNFSETATASLGQLEMRVMTVLSYVRGHSEVYKDTASLVATNSSIQWRAWATMGLQLLSLVVTTCFIRRLFHAPRGKFAVST